MLTVKLLGDVIEQAVDEFLSLSVVAFAGVQADRVERPGANDGGYPGDLVSHPEMLQLGIHKGIECLAVNGDFRHAGNSSTGSGRCR